jgi:hydroxyacylglutathione hydrolase
MYRALNEKLGSLPDNTRVYCGHEYTETNLRFALHVEPGNEATQARMRSVRERRAKAAPDWHGATEAEMTVPSTIADERATNPFMRVDSPEIRQTVQRAHPNSPADPISVLGRIRAMKDSF